MTRETSSPTALLVHDGELADVRALLEQLRTPFVERLGLIDREDRGLGWDLVIATPKRMLELSLPASEAGPTQIAILEQDSRTLRNSLRRAGISLIVRRPVHRAALRALILHALYRGPEKRRNTRVPVGAPVRVKTGWRGHDAILADLSVTGCRLITDLKVARGSTFTLQVKSDVAAGKAFSVKARALQSGPVEGGAAGSRFLTARFEKVSRRQFEALHRTVEAHSQGPASYTGDGAIASSGPPSKTATTRPPGPAEPAPPPPGRPERPDPEATLETVGSSEVAIAAGDDALTGEQRAALDEEASRVLMGHDISIGGMRVRPTSALSIGMNIELAIHVEQRDEPLVVRARVHRDEGERGVVLRFHELPPEASHYLNDMMDQLPIVDSGSGGYLVTEVLNTL